MSPTVRRQVIVNFLDEYGPQTVRELGARMSIDQNTIGRELNALEDEGRVKREHISGWTTATRAPRFIWRLIA